MATSTSVGRNSRVVVIGSINIDLITRVTRFPRIGETLTGGDLVRVPGGKGANQAVAAARMGAEVTFVGRVGSDPFGAELRQTLESAGVDVRHVRTTRGPSGAALIFLHEHGDNAIVLSPGANAQVTIADVRKALPAIRQAGVVLLQLEIPLDVVEFAIKTCRRLGVRVILDPAPVHQALPDTLLDFDVLCPNEIEAATLAQKTVGADERSLAQSLRARGARTIVLKLGASGSVCYDTDDQVTRSSGFKVKVVDTTAAGDTMTAALAVALTEQRGWPDALRFANAAGAIACTRLGAQPSIPTRRQVDAFLRRHRT